MEVQDQPKIDVPSKRALVKATGIAFLVAVILLFVAVLPAEYGFDPLKTGSLLGLTRISQAQVKEVKRSRADARTRTVGSLQASAQDL
jgi:hypothetical protein